MTLPRNPRSHFLLPDHITKTEFYRGSGHGSKLVVPPQPRSEHAAHLRANFATLKTVLEDASEAQRNDGWDSGFGLSIKFSSFPDVELAFDRFDLKSHGIELLNVRCVAQSAQEVQSKQIMVATVWLPHGKLSVFEVKIKAYLECKLDKHGKPDKQLLIDAIQDVRAAVIEDV